MVFQFSQVPNFNVNVQPMPDPIAKAARRLQRNRSYFVKVRTQFTRSRCIRWSAMVSEIRPCLSAQCFRKWE